MGEFLGLGATEADDQFGAVEILFAIKFVSVFPGDGTVHRSRVHRLRGLVLVLLINSPEGTGKMVDGVDRDHVK